MAVKIRTTREMFYDITELYDLEDKRKDFFKLVQKQLKKTNEIKLPMHLFEKIFEFNFHRGVKHPIASNVVYRFKSRGFKVSKVRNKYLVRIKKVKKEK